MTAMQVSKILLLAVLFLLYVTGLVRALRRDIGKQQLETNFWLNCLDWYYLIISTICLLYIVVRILAMELETT